MKIKIVFLALLVGMFAGSCSFSLQCARVSESKQLTEVLQAPDISNDDMALLLNELDNELKLMPEISFWEKGIIVFNMLVLRAEKLGVCIKDLSVRLVKHIEDNKMLYSTVLSTVLLIVGVTVYYFAGTSDSSQQQSVTQPGS